MQLHPGKGSWLGLDGKGGVFQVSWEGDGRGKMGRGEGRGGYRQPTRGAHGTQKDLRST